MSGPRSLVRVEYLLPVAVAVSAVCVGVSEFMDTFEFDLATSGEAQRTVAAADRHHYALLVLALFALFALAVAVVAGSRPAAVAVAVAGGLSLLFFLIVDLPDVGQQGSLDEPSRVFFSSEADPSGGFWLELVGTLGLALSGAALATLRPDQLRMLGGRGRGRPSPHETATEDEVARPAVKRRSAHEGRSRRHTPSR